MSLLREALYDDKQQKGDRDAYTSATNSYAVPSASPTASFPTAAHIALSAPLVAHLGYLDLDIQTADEPLTLESLTAASPPIPLKNAPRFTSPDPELAKIWEISWRTARLDAHETYMDTPTTSSFNM